MTASTPLHPHGDVVAVPRVAAFEAGRFAKAVTDAADKSHNETEFRTRLHPTLEDVASRAGVNLEFRGEFSLASGGRADAIYNRLVVEFEAPGSLRLDVRHGHTAHAIGQVVTYLRQVAKQHKHAERRLLGMAFDGRVLVFVHRVDGSTSIEQPMEWSAAAAERFIRALLSLSAGRALIPDHLIEDFGADSLLSQNAIKAFYKALERGTSPFASALFAQWQVFFSEVTAYEHALQELKKKKKKDLLKLTAALESSPSDIDLSRLLFSIHTYFSLLAKTIAHLVLHRYAGGALGATPLTNLAAMSGEPLRRELGRLEAGGIFKDLGFTNLLEGDFFSWYLEAWAPDIEQSVRDVMGRLGAYDPTTIELAPTAARDLLKKLYQYLMPGELRHDLGEYYTPDWLASYTLGLLSSSFNDYANEAREGGSGQPPDPLLAKRLIDPACGSGTFLVLAIRGFRKHAERAGLSEADTLKLILDNVVGIDLNPLAVLAARVSFLLAIGDLVPYRQGPVAIPVYLADSIVVPAEGQTLFDKDERSFDTVVGRFGVPVTLKSADAIGRLAELLYEYVESQMSRTSFLDRARAEFKTQADGTDEQILGRLYDLSADLKSRQLDGIWARILKNRFMPLFLGEFDFVVGNPPWIGWESLPAGYRQQTTALWQTYGLFVHSGMDTILGKGRKDLCTLMTLVVADKFLKPKGRLAFIITQTVFKGAGAPEGFRRFRLPDGTPLKVLSVDDLGTLQPFQGAATRTSVLVLDKGLPTKYPIPYSVWHRLDGKVRLNLSFETSAESILLKTRRTKLAAIPVDATDESSSWLTATPASFPAIRKILGSSDYEAHEGVNSGGANGVYWLEVLNRRPDGLLVIRNLTEGTKREVDQVTAAVEPELVYPLLKYSDVGKWRAVPSAHILMTQDPRTRRGIDQDTMQGKYPNTWRYLKRFEVSLRERAAFKRYFTKRVSGRPVDVGPFYSMFNVGSYTFAPYKVVWPNIGDLGAAVVSQVDGKLVMPQHIVTLVATSSLSEAHYLASCINSAPFQLALHAYSQTGGKSYGDPHILENLKLPKFDARNAVHGELAATSRAAHAATAQGKGATEFDAVVDRLGAQLWSLTDKELAAVIDAASQTYAVLDPVRPERNGEDPDASEAGPLSLKH